MHADCREAAQSAGALLESLGHHVEPALPDALGDAEFGRRFGALWSTNMGVARRAASRRSSAATLQRRRRRADQPGPGASSPRSVSAVDYAMACRRERRVPPSACSSGGPTGWDLLLTPTLAELPPTLGTFVNDPDDPMAPMSRAGAFVPFTPAFNTSGQPAISLPLHWTADGLPVGVQLVAAYGREDVLLRVAAQLEQASPWAHRHPPV